MPKRSLQDFVSEVSCESHLRIEHDFGDGFVRLHTSEAERRQAAQDIQCSENIVLELLRNARDAHASHVFLAYAKEGKKRIITVIDDGDGIPLSMHKAIFEPRVTSKLNSSRMDAWGFHGRGMALFSIAQNAIEACVASSDAKLGCAIVVSSDTSKLPEKTDQSSFPCFTLSDENTVNVRGPRNILRTSCEFAIEARDDCSVYVGSPAEIAASLYSYGSTSLSAVERVFCQNELQLPVTKRLVTASDAQHFSQIASAIGLSISSRTAQRIINGQITDVPSLLDQITIANRTERGRRTQKKVSHCVKIQQDDTRKFCEQVCEAYRSLAEQYYLNSNVETSVRITREKITVTIPLVEKN